MPYETCQKFNKLIDTHVLDTRRFLPYSSIGHSRLARRYRFAHSLRLAGHATWHIGIEPMVGYSAQIRGLGKCEHGTSINYRFLPDDRGQQLQRFLDL